MVLRGMSIKKPQLMPQEQLPKALKNASQLCMLQLLCSSQLSFFSVENKEQPHIPSDLQELLESFSDLFQEPTALPPSRGSFDHKIPLKEGTSPINIRPYRYPLRHKDIIEALVEEMQAKGVIQCSSSPFASPVVLVGKKDGTWRLCVDYRELNKNTVKDKFPIPVIEELLDELASTSIYSKIDLRAGYHQVRMHVNDIPKTAFKTHSGHYEFLVMPFEKTNAPATFQALMNEIFRPYLRKFVLVFFDDILIYSTTLQEHLLHLEQVFLLMRQHQLFAKYSKCCFGMTRVEYLGYFISHKGVETDTKKIEVIAQWPEPKTQREVRSFLGLTGYHRRFIKGYALLSKAVTELLKKDGFEWNPEAAIAFQKLKAALMTAPVLALPDFEKPFEVEADASSYVIGAVLQQQGHTIAFISKKLGPKWQQLSVYEKELLAIVFAIKNWE